jgi:hypothetical protein
MNTGTLPLSFFFVLTLCGVLSYVPAALKVQQHFGINPKLATTSSSIERSSIHRLFSSNFRQNGGEMFDGSEEKPERVPIAPSRNDLCEMFVSGYIGTEPKEVYLANGHYVVNFAVIMMISFSHYYYDIFFLRRICFLHYSLLSLDILRLFMIGK